jgi:hypothetical protein
VIQEYVDEPLLLDGLKFDLRLYVLVLSVQPLTGYLFRQGMARFATNKYKRPTDKNLRDVFMHLTNYSLNKRNTGAYVKAKGPRRDDDESDGEEGDDTSDDDDGFATDSDRGEMGVLKQMTTRRAMVGATAAMLAGCRKASAIRDPIRISVNRRPGMAGLYQAVESGYFAEVGVPVELVTMGVGMEVVPVLAQGGVDVSFFPSNAAVFNAVARGARIRLVAGREIARAGCSDFGAIYGGKEAFPGGLRDLRRRYEAVPFLKNTLTRTEQQIGSNEWAVVG